MFICPREEMAGRGWGKKEGWKEEEAEGDGSALTRKEGAITGKEEWKVWGVGNGWTEIGGLGNEEVIGKKEEWGAGATEGRAENQMSKEKSAKRKGIYYAEGTGERNRNRREKANERRKKRLPRKRMARRKFKWK